MGDGVLSQIVLDARGRLTLLAKVFLDISISIDGYTAGPDDTLEQPWAGAGTAS